MEKKLSIEEVQRKISEYFEGARANFGIQSYGCSILVSIKYWDFHTERQVRRNIEDISDNINIVAIERLITDSAYTTMLTELFDKEITIYTKDEDKALRETTLMEFIDSHTINHDFGTQRM